MRSTWATVLGRGMLFRRGARNHRFPFVFLGEFNDFSDPGRPPPFPLETLSFSVLLWILILRGLVRRVGFLEYGMVWVLDL